MKQGQYITERLLPIFVREAASRQGIACSTLSDDWVLQLQRGAETKWILGYQFDLNLAAASAVAQDKVATHLLLKQFGIDSIEHYLVRSLPHQAIHEKRLVELFGNKPFVIKPLDGTGGRGVQKVSSATQAAEIINESDEVAWAASPYYELTTEYRVVMLDGQALVSYEKTEPTSLHGLALFNLGLGAKAVDITDNLLLAKLCDIAARSCTAASLRLAAADIASTTDGRLVVIELNDGIMMENYARQSPENKDRAAGVYDAIVQAMFK